MTKERKYALLSVFDKTGIVELANTLHKKGYLLISTGGTAKTLEQANIPIIPIHTITGNPESFDGRMKTISFQIESGILYRRDRKSHVKDAKRLGVKKIDIVVCNLYPFEQTLKNKRASHLDIVEQIDVGGPTMIRAAGKNHEHVLVVTNPDDYQSIIEKITKDTITTSFRKELAAKAFQHLAFYDAQIGRYLSDNTYPNELTLPARKGFKLRYGENPHQNPSYVYFDPQTRSPLSRLTKQVGRELSYVNFTDIASGLEVVQQFKEPAAVVIKHNSPCGIATGKNAVEALQRAVEADPLSAFGGVVILNCEIDEKAARAFAAFKENRVQMDIVAAPSLSKQAKEIIHSVRKTTGIYTFGKLGALPKHRSHIKHVHGGFVTQPWDDNIEKQFKNWECVTKVKPTKQQLKQMQFAWKCITRIRSNSIIVVDKHLPMTRGIGSGQTARVFSTQIALKQAGKHVKGGVLASDSFFPFDDSVKLCAKYGIGAIVQQGDSINDKASTDAANKAKIPMVSTHIRAFWH